MDSEVNLSIEDIMSSLAHDDFVEENSEVYFADG